MSSLPLTILGLLSVTLILWQWRAAVRFPVHQRRPGPAPSLPMTLLKPLKGCDGETEASLLSWLEQDYAGPVQILFGVSTADDPACGLVRRLMARYPNRDLELVDVGPPLGANGKVSNLFRLAGLARHEILVVSDADVRAPSDLLGQLALQLGESRDALVCCLYRLANPVTAAMQWEAAAVNSDFWSQVLQARSMATLNFALGATMALHREALEDVGGFKPLVNRLADDFELGHRLSRRGGNVLLSTVVVDCWEAPRNWKEVWLHQLRWARTIRVCRPASYFFSILANSTFWLLFLLAASGPWGDGTWTWGLPAVVAGLSVRAVTAWDQQRRLAAGTVCCAPWWMPWLKDLLQIPIWAGAFLGSTVEWRGNRYRVRRGGRLEPLGAGTALEGD